MTDKVIINRLSTGVPGLDVVLAGGLPEFSFNLIAGPPGCGKTTLAHQLMFALATPERPALYFTVLGEPPLKMLRYQQQFAFFDSNKVNTSIRFINLSDETAAGDLGVVLGKIATHVQAHNPALVFVDSFRSVILANEGAGQSHGELQMFLQQLGMLMTTWQATTFFDWRVFQRSRRQSGIHRGRWPYLATPEHPAQLHGAQDGDPEDARSAHLAWLAHFPHQPERTAGFSTGWSRWGARSCHDQGSPGGPFVHWCAWP